MSAPRLRVQLGPIPLYLIDLPLLLTAYFAMQVPKIRRLPLGGAVVVILAAAFVSEVSAGVRMGTLSEPLYLIGRTFLAGSLFFSARRIVNSERAFQAVVKAALLGAIITSILMITTSLPQTRGLVLDHVFSQPYLEPASEGVTSKYGDTYQGVAARGRSLVGVSILSAAFLNTIWPLLFLMRRQQSLGRAWRLLLILAAVLIPIAVVMSYSRGAILGLLLIIIMVLFFNTRRVRQPLVLGIGVALLIFYWVGWDSDYFFFERIEGSMQSALEDPYNNISVTERLFAYHEPFQHLIDHPEFLFVGQGFARSRVSGHTLTAGMDAATHAAFAASYYGYGLFAALTYVVLLLRALWTTVRHIYQPENEFASSYSRALFAGMMGFLSWFLLGHAAVSQPRGAMLLFLVFGLVAAQPGLSVLPKAVKRAQERRP